MEECSIGRVKDWKGVRLEECRIGRVKDWKGLGLEGCRVESVELKGCRIGMCDFMDYTGSIIL